MNLKKKITYFCKDQYIAFACEQCWLLLFKGKGTKREDFVLKYLSPEGSFLLTCSFYCGKSL